MLIMASEGIIGHLKSAGNEKVALTERENSKSLLMKTCLGTRKADRNVNAFSLPLKMLSQNCRHLWILRVGFSRLN